MITFLRGVLAESIPSRAVVDVGGVGYEVSMPVSCYDRLPAEGQEVRILVHHHVREQEETLYGFVELEERDLFRLLIARVSGVGPKLALAVLSGMGVGDFKNAVVQGDIDLLSSVKGLGRKTAERIVVELKDKVGVVEAWEAAAGPAGAGGTEGTAFHDAVLALISLGYKQAEATKALRALQKAGDLAPGATADDLLRAALRSLN